MDDARLKRLLGGAVPPPNARAREDAIGGAVAEFARVQQEQSEKSQGFRPPGRLTNYINRIIRRRTMNKRIAIGGLGLAAAAALAVVGVQNFLVQHPLPTASYSVAPTADINHNRQPNASVPAQESGKLLHPGASVAVPASTAYLRPSASVAADEPSASPPREWRDQFQHTAQNPVRVARSEPVSTFSVDVDTASYSFVRRAINQGALPPKDAVRVEEMLNYFDYAYPLPENPAQPFRPTVNVLPAPWNPSNFLLHIGIKGYDIMPSEAPAANLVFLIDVSGSMGQPDKLPLVKNSLKLLLESLKPDDSVGIVVYAGAAGAVLEPTPARNKFKILRALQRLEAGGSTAGAEGIQLAYQMAESRFDKDAVNRIIIATDGDFNVGMTSLEELKGLIERKRRSGVFLSLLGFGRGNLNDRLMQQLAQNGNGVAAYIDTLNEARKVLVQEASSSLFPIASDVKIQVEFNPARVAEYRLIGYETRALRREDFNNDAVDAGDIGAGHSVTALYEITPPGGARLVEERRYQSHEQTPAPAGEFADEYAFLKIRYKRPGEDASNLLTAPITTEHAVHWGADATAYYTLLATVGWAEARWAAAVAGFAQLLKGGRYTGDFNYDDVIHLAEQHKGRDPFGYRAEFIQLVRLAKSAAAIDAAAPSPEILPQPSAPE